jgi:hypothetical protein
MSSLILGVAWLFIVTACFAFIEPKDNSHERS